MKQEKPKKQKTYYTLRVVLKPEMREAVRLAAEAQDMSASAWVRMLIREELNTK